MLLLRRAALQLQAHAQVPALLRPPALAPAARRMPERSFCVALVAFSFHISFAPCKEQGAAARAACRAFCTILFAPMASGAAWRYALQARPASQLPISLTGHSACSSSVREAVLMAAACYALFRTVGRQVLWHGPC